MIMIEPNPKLNPLYILKEKIRNQILKKYP